MSIMLEGIRVVELGTHVAIPKASRVLSEWGAESIKIEPPKGEAWRTMGRLWNMPYTEDNNPILQSENANKKSLVLNLKDPDGKEALFKLLEQTDVFMTNTRPKALRKLGIDYESIRERFPKLIYVTLSGYGEQVPPRTTPALTSPPSGPAAAYAWSGWKRGRSPSSPTPASATPPPPGPLWRACWARSITGSRPDGASSSRPPCTPTPSGATAPASP